MTEAFVYHAIRTPRGRGKATGALHSVKPISLVVALIDAMRQRNPGLCSVEDANIGAILGIGFPSPYGGVMQFVDQYAGDVASFVARARQLAARYGDRFLPPADLVARAAAAGSERTLVAAS